jgi:hypothetical protein
MGNTYNIAKHRRGDTWPGIKAIGITINGSPIDLSDAQIDMELKRDYDYPAVLKLSTTTSTISVLPQLSAFTILPQVIEIPPAIYKYDIQIKTHISSSTLSAVNTYIEGTWEIYFDITR